MGWVEQLSNQAVEFQATTGAKLFNFVVNDRRLATTAKGPHAMSNPKTKRVPLDKGLLRYLCRGSRPLARALREVLFRWRSTRFEDWGYPVVRMSHENWAAAFDVSVKSSHRLFHDLTNMNLIHRRKVEATNGTGFVVCPSYRTQLTVSAFLLDTGRVPKEVPKYFIIGLNPMKVHTARYDTSIAVHEQTLLAGIAGEAIAQGGLSAANDLKIAEELARFAAQKASPKHSNYAFPNPPVLSASETLGNERFPIQY